MGILDFWKKAPAVADAPPPKDPEQPSRGQAWGVTIRNSPLTGGFFKEYVGAVPNPNQVLNYERSKAGTGYQGSPIDLITEMLDKDPKITGLLQSRVANVLQLDAAIQQYGEGEDPEKASRLIDRVGEQIGGWHRLEEEMLEKGIAYGLSYHEILWDVVKFPLEMGERPRVKEWIVPVAYRQIAPNRIGFDAQSRVMVYTNFGKETPPDGWMRSGDENWWYPHPLGVIAFSRRRDNDNPYGKPLLTVLFYKAWFKRLMDKWWAQYNERYADPLHWVEVDMEANLNDDDITALQTILSTIAQATDALMPAGTKLHRLEITGNSATNTFQQIINNFDDQAAILISGQTSTSSAARQGSGAQSEVHERNALAIYSSDARCLESTMNQLFKLIVMVNDESLQYVCPTLNINTRSVEEVLKWTEVLKAGLEAGVEIPAREWFRRTGIDQRIGKEKILELQPANYAAGFGSNAPSQQRGAKTQAKQQQRQRSAPARSQAQPRPSK